MSFLQYFLMQSESFTTRIDGFGRKIFIIRWISWFFNTAMVVLMIANLSNLGRRRIFLYAACQSALILFGFMVTH
jgi:bacteriorhodopsin